MKPHSHPKIDTDPKDPGLEDHDATQDLIIRYPESEVAAMQFGVGLGSGTIARFVTQRVVLPLFQPGGSHCSHVDSCAHRRPGKSVH